MWAHDRFRPTLSCEVLHWKLGGLSSWGLLECWTSLFLTVCMWFRTVLIITPRWFMVLIEYSTSLTWVSSDSLFSRRKIHKTHSRRSLLNLGKMELGLIGANLMWPPEDHTIWPNEGCCNVDGIKTVLKSRVWAQTQMFELREEPFKKYLFERPYSSASPWRPMVCLGIHTLVATQHHAPEQVQTSTAQVIGDDATQETFPLKQAMRLQWWRLIHH